MGCQWRIAGGGAVRANGSEMFRKWKKRGAGNGKKAGKTVKNGEKNAKKCPPVAREGGVTACEGCFGRGERYGILRQEQREQLRRARDVEGTRQGSGTGNTGSAALVQLFYLYDRLEVMVQCCYGNINHILDERVNVSILAYSASTVAAQ